MPVKESKKPMKAVAVKRRFNRSPRKDVKSPLGFECEKYKKVFEIRDNLSP